MTRFVLRTVFTMLLTFIVLSQYAIAQRSDTSAWKPEEMTRSGTKDLKSLYKNKKVEVKALHVWLNNLKRHLEENNLKEEPPTNCSDQCFDLYYFTGNNFNLNSSRRNILYIAGGPGQIVKSPRPLSFLEDDHNVVYFNLRGAGLSVIPRSNSFDKYLKAEYVVEDIERMRKVVLKGEKWDAIYGFSYGTVVAQRYAHEYSNNVNRLILEAPIVRNIDFAGQRTEMALNNLEKIYRLISSEPSEPCDCTGRALIAAFDDGTPSHTEANNFCFLTPPTSSPENLESRIKTIRDSLKEIYKNLEEEYGVLGFLTENYDSEQKNSRYKSLFGYPKEFVFALRQLQNIGVPEKDSLKFVSQIDDWVDVALVLGYYAMSKKDQLCAIGKDCMANNPFLKFVTNDNCKRKNIYLNRIKTAKENILENTTVTESQRALYVYSINDGMHRWLFNLVNGEAPSGAADVCLNADEPRRFMQKTGPEHGLLRNIIKKIGFDNANEPCLWNPTNSQHKVQSLVLKGEADAVTAGCQAEIFFNEGLKGSRVMIEFPGMGHGLYELYVPFGEDSALPEIFREIGVGPSEKQKKTIQNYKQIIENFLEVSSLAKYKQNIQNNLKELKAKDRTPPNSERIEIQSCMR